MNIMQILKQAQDVQGKMADVQERLEQVELCGKAANDQIQVTISGKGVVRKLKIAPSLVDPNEVEMLEDLIVAALRDAKTQVDALTAAETEKAMGGMKLPPGFKMPF